MKGLAPLWDAARESGRWSRGVAAPLHLAGCQPEAQPAAVLPAVASMPADPPALPSDLPEPLHSLAAAGNASTEQLLEAAGHAVHQRVNKSQSFLQLAAFPYNRDQFTG